MKADTGGDYFYDTVNSEPYDFYERVRERGEVVWDAAMNAWLVTSYDLSREILKDDELFAHPYAVMRASDQYLKIRSNNPRSFHFLTGDQHKAMHRWYFRDLLSPKWVEQYRAVLVEEVVQRRLSQLSGRESFDIVEDFAEWIPLGVFARLLGLPDESDSMLRRLKSLNDRIGEFATIANSLKLEGNETSDEDKAITECAIAAATELDGMLTPLVHERRSGTGEDFISRLWAGGPAIFSDWNEVDTLDACRRLMFAGIDTTTHAIANAFYMALSDPQLHARLKSGDKATLEHFVEEVLRLNGSVQFRPRRVARDTELAGTPIKAGDMVVVFLLAANRDPEHYKCPHAVDLERASPRDHIAFNYGSRSCLGAALARAELAVAVSEGIRQFPEMRLDPASPQPSFRGLLHRSYRPIHVRVD